MGFQLPTPSPRIRRRVTTSRRSVPMRAMQVTRTIAETRAAVAAARRSGRRIGFVPTMGSLHAGHLSLVEAARRDDTLVVVSIFVNPTQFGPNEDYARYPRDEAGDLTQCGQAGVDLVFVPAADDMYSPGSATTIGVARLTDTLCGPCRPGHFDGVATVVAKLFNIVQPDRAYFGQKDAQQLAVIRRMTRDLNIPVEIVGCPTVREPDGLAMSSRNTYLSPEERLAGPVLRRSLDLAEELWLEGERDAERIRKEMTDLIEQEPLARVDYVSIADTRTLDEIHVIDRKALVSLAVRIGKTRLIDNAILPPGEPLIARRQP